LVTEPKKIEPKSSHAPTSRRRQRRARAEPIGSTRVSDEMR
jgi:hypothetical protein